TIIKKYPPIRSLKYAPPAAIPQAERLFCPGQKAEDTMLRQLQYALSGIICPLDVLEHMLLPLLPSDHRDRIFLTIHDICTLILNTAGMVNYQRNQLALRAINPGFCTPGPEKDYTMPAEAFKDTVSNLTTMQKMLREARGSRSHTHRLASSSLSFFRTSPSEDQPQHSNTSFHQNNNSTHQNHTNPQLPRNTNHHTLHTRHQWIHSVVKEGIKLHFSRLPPLTTQYREIQAQSPQQRALLRQEIADLLHKRAIEPAPLGLGFCSSMFVILKCNRGFRLVFNLKALNWFLTPPHFKMETLQYVVQLIVIFLTYTIIHGYMLFLSPCLYPLLLRHQQPYSYRLPYSLACATLIRLYQSCRATPLTKALYDLRPH
ncbi:hypothetical protein BJV82DRAFT_519106, partial [Fennellomyces sp. T-0311]